jgi:hypothetical protein
VEICSSSSRKKKIPPPRNRIQGRKPDSGSETGFRVGNVDKRARQAARRWRIARCEKSEAATEHPIAAPAWPSYGTHPPLRNLCDLRTVRAAGSGFRGRHRALCAGRGVLGRLFGLRDAARPRTWRYVIAHCMRDKVTPASPRRCCTVTCTRPRAGRLHGATSRLER